MADPRPPKSATILVVDRDEKSRAALTTALKGAHPDFRFFYAQESEGALRAAEAHPPDLVFLDVLMPDNEGFDLCLLFKTDERYKDVPLLIITALDRPEAKIKGYRLGVSDYILKPIDAEETVARADAQLRMKRFQDRQKELNEELRRTQSALLQSSKMSAAGTLASGIAHEFNNILHVISASAELCAYSDNLDEVRAMAATIQECARRGGKVARSLLDFASRDELQKKEKIDVAEILRRDLHLLDKTLRAAGITVKQNIAGAPPVECFPGQLSQIFVNLIHNAVDAMLAAPVRRLEVTLRTCDCGSVCTADRTANREKAKGCVLVSFRDTGPGVPVELRDRIFEPFVTTKGIVGGGSDSTPGTGLGLSISYGIAQRHGGHIGFESEEGKGAIFTLNLPIG